MGEMFHGDGSNVVFVIGSPRSGTTWLQKMVASHPLVATSQESNFFISYGRALIRAWKEDLADDSGRGGIGLPCYLTEEEFYRMLGLVFEESIVNRVLRRNPGACVFLEKTPSHALVVGEIHRALPRARFIFIVRDPRDVVASMTAAAKTWGKMWAPSNTFRALAMWRRHVRSAREGLAAIPAELSIMIRYEDMVEDPGRVLRGVFSFIGLQASEEGQIERYVAQNAFDNARKGGFEVYGEVGRKMGGTVSDPVAFVRKGKVGGWREDLGLLRGWVIKRLAQREMSYYNYS